MANVVWRDDDIFAHEGMRVKVDVETAFAKFVLTHEMLRRYDALHTIAVLAAGIPYNPLWVDYINNHRDEFDIQLHGLVHMDYAEPLNYRYIKHNIKMAVAMMEVAFGLKPTIFYPPWNRIDDYSRQIIEDLGLTISYEKIALPQFIDEVGNVADGTVINFHHWADEDVRYLEAALNIWQQGGNKSGL